MDVSTTLSLVQTILTAIQTLGLMHSVCSISNCKSELDDLHNTVETVRAVLMDADAKQDSLNFQEKNYIQELKDAVFDADDVLDPKSRKLHLNNLEWLKSMPTEYSQFIVEIRIQGDERMESLGEVKAGLLSSLRTLHIDDCLKLKSVGGWLEHLSALEDLTIVECPEVELGGMSWHNLAATLQSLALDGINKMEELPEGMQFCTSLLDIIIVDSPKLKFLPKWMPKLTSLQKLDIAWCSASLFKRCQQPNGEDWPLIQHIPELTVW